MLQSGCPMTNFPSDGSEISRWTCQNSQHTETMPETLKEHALGRVERQGTKGKFPQQYQAYVELPET